MTTNNTQSHSDIWLAAVGDIMIGDQIICLGHGVGSLIKKKGLDFIFEKVVNTLRTPDILVGNLEVPLTDLKSDSVLQESYKGRKKDAEGLVKVGFNVLSIANNHTTSYGSSAFNDTIDALRKTNILPIGIADQTMNFETNVLSVKGIDIGFLSYSFHPDTDPKLTKHAKKSQDVVPIIREMKNKADIICVSLHWGDEYVSYPSLKQIEIAHDLVNAGADIIIGHHPHVLQGIEVYKNRVIAYSLGNFVFDKWQDETKDSMILMIKLSKDRVIDYKILPVRINEHFQPELLNDVDGDRITSKIEKLSSSITTQDPAIYGNPLIYTNMVKDKKRWNKKEVRKYFLANLHKYPSKVRTQLIKKGLVGRGK